MHLLNKTSSKSISAESQGSVKKAKNQKARQQLRNKVVSLYLKAPRRRMSTLRLTMSLMLVLIFPKSTSQIHASTRSNHHTSTNNQRLFDWFMFMFIDV
mmetsp:Transcript_158/g.211  ORF Transcript_158/g.211 Transcript_158/m.211 type:complete len:99 (-) Transcript_158:63-359(-)